MKNDFNISDGVLYISDGVIELADQRFAERNDFKKAVLPSTLRILGTEVFSVSLRSLRSLSSFKGKASLQITAVPQGR